MVAFEIDNDVTFSANDFDKMNKNETKKNLLNSAVLGIFTRFSSGFREEQTFKVFEFIGIVI